MQYHRSNTIILKPGWSGWGSEIGSFIYKILAEYPGVTRDFYLGYFKFYLIIFICQMDLSPYL